MVYLTASLIGSYSYNFYLSEGKGPLNPFLGETFEGEMSCGTKFYLEHISLKPSTSAVYIIGPDEDFVIDGQISFDISVSPTITNATSNF